MSVYRKISILLAATCIIMANAQEVKFTASSTGTAKVGQQFQYAIQGNEQGDVMLPEVDGIDFLAGPFTSFSSSTQWVNGKMTAQNTATYTYILRGNSAGSYTIPPATVKVKRETYKTNPVNVTLVSAGEEVNNSQGSGQGSGQTATSGSVQNEGQPVFLRILPSKKDVYVGEQLISELKVYTSVNTRPAGGVKEVPYEGFYKYSVDADQVSSRENVNGKIHVTQVLQRHILVPQKAGKMVIEPFESEWTIPQRTSNSRPRSMFDEFFDDPFFDNYRDVPVTISTRPVTINVKPLPEGAPSGFTGAVGDFTVTAELSDDNVTVNDALSLTVKINGTGNLELIGTPKIDFPPDHDVYETTKSARTNTSGNRISGSVTFEYPIVARHAGNFRIAPLKFSWFDPGSGKYKSFETDEFRFTVAKGEGADEGGQIYVPGIRGNEVENIGTDILDITRKVPVFTKIGKTPLNSLLYWTIYAGILLLFIAMVTVFRVSMKRRADIRLVRNRKANKMARSRLKLADRSRKTGDAEKFFEETEKAIWGYLSDKLSIELSELSRESVVGILENAGVDRELTGQCLEIIDDCEFSRYAPSSEKSDMNLLYQSAVDLIHQLEQNIGKR